VSTDSRKELQTLLSQGARKIIITTIHKFGEAEGVLDDRHNIIAMVDEARVRNGTRYDAQRMLAVLPWERAGGQLTRYLSKEVDAELQMGAIAGLADMQDARAADALAAHMAEYTERNRAIAIDGLLKTDAGRTRLKTGLTSGTVSSAWLTPEQRAKLER